MFGHADGVRPLAAALMQRWALILSAYSYKIEYIPSSANQCANCLSCLPVPSVKIHPAEKGNEIHAVNCTSLPVTAKDIASRTAKDKILSRVSTCVHHGTWPFPIPDELAPYHRKKEELTLQDGCILWGKRVIIPQKLQSRLLDELHVGHVGVCRMKALTRSFIWWPGLDQAIEETASQGQPCKITAAMPKPVVRHPWQHPNKPWERVHIDYGQWGNYHFFVLVDAFSKWPEIKLVSTTTTRMTINILSDIFTRYGFPQIIVSDNGPQFTSVEFKDFLCQNHIIHHNSPPYHPATNRLAENMVKNIKAHLKKHNHANIHRSISDFLRTYRNVPHTTTGTAPVHLVLAQAPRTHLSMTLPSVCQRVKLQLQPTPEQTHAKVCKFTLGDRVLVPGFRPASTSKWQRGTITAICGKLIYQVDCEGNLRQVHIDHLLPAPTILEAPTTSSDDNTVVDVTNVADVPLSETPPQNSIILPQSIPVPDKRKSSRVRSPPKRLIEEL